MGNYGSYEILILKDMVYQNNGVDNPVTGAYEEGMDSLRHMEHKVFSNDAYYSRLLREAVHYYADMEPLREKWLRANDFFMGRQLNDYVVFEGRKMRTIDYLKLRGLPIFQNDIISDKVLTLKGLMRQEDMAATCKATDAQEDMFAEIFSEFLRKNDGVNRRQQLKAEFFQEFLLYAFCCAKVNWTEREGREDVYVDKVDLFHLAFPAFEKSGLEDVNFIAEAHDMLWSDLLKQFGVDRNGNASFRAEEELKDIYARQGDTLHSQAATGDRQADIGNDFLHPTVVGKYRVIEIWKKERNRALWYHDRATADVGYRPLADRQEIDAENARRLSENIRRDENGMPLLDAEGNETYYVAPEEVRLIEYQVKIEEFWYYRFLSPTGYLLAEGVSPYRVVRGGYGFRYRPYVFVAYPCVHGETRSLVDRCEDKQRAANHYMIMLDSLLSHSMKGVAIDVKSETAQQPLDEMIHQATKPNGVVLYDGTKGDKPTQLQGSNIPAGLEWMINQNESMMVGQSGVQGALQGVHRNTSGKQYQMERESASTTVADYFGAFYDFDLRISKVQLWMIQQFYDSTRSVKLTGEDVKTYWNPETMSDVNGDLELEMDANSAVMREANNDMLWQLMLQNRIDVLTMLDCGAWSNTAKLKKGIREWQMQQAQGALPIPPQGGGNDNVNVNDNRQPQSGSLRRNGGGESVAPPQPTVGTGATSA